VKEQQCAALLSVPHLLFELFLKRKVDTTPAVCFRVFSPYTEIPYRLLITRTEMHEERIQILTEANVKMTVFWDVAPCNFVEFHGGFRSACCLLLQDTLVMKAASTFETSVNLYKTKWRKIPEDSHLHKCMKLEKCNNHSVGLLILLENF
jgi:hypothetical protein